MGRRITESCKQRILDSAEVQGVLSDFIHLQQRGAGFWACCPFHRERTPSFYVNPARNSWHCFSCHKHGDAVSFLREHQGMSFQEALEYIARKYSIEVRYDSYEPTDKEKEDAKRRESARAAIDAVQEFFVSSLQGNSPEAQKAREYAYGRWGEEFCKEFGIGYAPRGSAALMEWCRRKGVPMEALQDAGCVKTDDKSKECYAFFRERITIPVVDRNRRLVAFTARYFGDNKDIAKYINSGETILFKKSRVVFGLGYAVKMARSMGQFLLVEGGPDVVKLHSLGLTHTVAPLSKNWCEEQFQMLKRVCGAVCFIPDSDPPKHDEEFGAGFQGVFRSGELALQAGLEVTVREIPAENGKQDPDSFMDRKEKLADLEEENFILWYARKLFGREGLTPGKRKEAVKTIARLTALLDDKYDRESVLSALPDIYGKGKLWKDELKQAQTQRRKDAEQSAGDPSDMAESMRRRFGIIEQNGKYYVSGKEDQMIRISNFTLTPVFHIKSHDNAIRIYRIVNEFGDEDAIELTQEEMVSLPRFKKRVENLGRFMWLGKAEHLDQMKEYLYSITKTCELVTLMGWNAENRFYAFGNGLFIGDRWIEADELGLVAYGGKTFYLPAFSEMHRNNKSFFSFEREFIHKPDSAISLHDYVAKLVEVFGDNAKVGFAFMLASLFRDVIYPIKDCFPILNLFGPPDSGKTSLGAALMALFHPVKEPPKLANTTIPSMNMMLSRVSNAVEILDEYKNEIDFRKLDIVKGVWGGKGQMKMNGETRKVEDTFFTCSLMLCGQEMPTKDPALFTRVIHLSYSRTEHSLEEKRRFKELKELSHRHNSHLTIELLQLRDAFEKRYAEVYSSCSEELMERLGSESIKDRIFDNWLVPLAAFRTAEALIDVPFSYRDLFEITLKGMKMQNEMVKKKSELADFWKLFASLYMNGRIIEGAHFRIVAERRFIPSGKGKRYDFDGLRPILYVYYDGVEQVLASRSGLNAAASKIDFPTLQPFLEMSTQYLGRKQVRLMKLNGMGTPEYTVEAQQKMTYNTRLTTLAFDYEAVKAEFDISLESFKMSEAEALDEEIEAQNPADVKPQDVQGSIQFGAEEADKEDMPF